MASQIFTPRFLILLVLIAVFSVYSSYQIYASGRVIDYQQFDGQIDDALELTINGNDVDAFKVFYPLAKKGVPRAKLYLAVAYYHGRGVKRDTRAARTLFFELQEENYEPHIISTYLNLISILPQS